MAEPNTDSFNVAVISMARLSYPNHALIVIGLTNGDIVLKKLTTNPIEFKTI
jgi:hypothetical protein